MLTVLNIIQPVEKSGCALGSIRLSGEFRVERSEKKETEMVIPFPNESIPKSVKTSNRAVKRGENIWFGEMAIDAYHTHSIRSGKRNARQGPFSAIRGNGRRSKWPVEHKSGQSQILCKR